MKKYAEFEALMPVITSLLDEGKEVEFTPFGYSMEPNISNGVDKVKIKRIPSYRKYDILFYQRDNQAFVLHRLVKIKKDKLIVCGDNHILVETINKDQVIAVVSSYTHKKKTYYRDKFNFRFKGFIRNYTRGLRRAYRAMRRRVRHG